MNRITILACVLALVVGGMGCAAKNRVTEEDRVVLDHTGQIVALLAASMSGAPAVALLADAGANVDQLQANWGKPKEPVPYSPEAAKLAREKSKGSHDVGFWGWLMGAALGAGGLALTLARTVGQYIPGFGPVFAVVDKLLLGAETAMAKLKAGGNVEAAKDLAKTLAEVQASNPAVKAYVDAKLPQIKEKYGVDLAGILAGAKEEPAVATSAPVPPAVIAAPST